MGAIVATSRTLCVDFFSKIKKYMIKNNPPKRLSGKSGQRPEAAPPNGFVVSESTTSTLNEITMALTRPNIIKLGVYGSSNSKKGTVVQKITRRVKRDNLFDVIVTASVVKKPELKKIQEELGNMLGLQLCGEKTSEGRARLLCGKIKTVGRILIILNDVWGEINLANG